MKLKREELTEKQMRYIDKNATVMAATDMARHLRITVYYVKTYLQFKGIEALTPKQWNAKMRPESNGLFNVDTYKGDYTWVM